MAVPKRPDKDARYRDRCFPNAVKEIFDPRKPKGGFVPLPIVVRLLVRFLHDSELRVWMYLQTRASRYCICYPTYGEMLHELGIGSKGTISKAIHGLERKGFIRSYNDRGVRRYLIRDPRLAAETLCTRGDLTPDDLDVVNDLLEQLRQPLVPLPKKKAKVVAMPSRKRA